MATATLYKTKTESKTQPPHKLSTPKREPQSIRIQSSNNRSTTTTTSTENTAKKNKRNRKKRNYHFGVDQLQ